MAGHSEYAGSSLRALSDEALLARLSALAAQERESAADVVEHLMEVERREIVIDLAYPSLFAYCVKTLGYSEAAAFYRIRAARAAARFPDILPRLRSGRLHLEAVVRLYPYLDENNNQDLLERASGASKREILSLLAGLQTEAGPARDVVVPVHATAPETVLEPPLDLSGVSSVNAVETNRAQPAAAEVVPPPRHRFHFTAEGELVALVDRLRGLLRHKFPEGRLEDIFREAARSLLSRLEREKLPLSEPRPEKAARSSRGRVVPKPVKRAVWARDDGRCAYVAEDGRRCESRDALEYDHVVPWADGGRSDSPDNVRLLCRAHNQRLARRRFGPRRKRL